MLMNANMKKNLRPDAGRMLEDMLGCKWSLAVLAEIRAGVGRPGQIERRIEGISKKVMNERLRKLQRFGIVDKRVFAEVPPRVEYRLTRFGSKFASLLDGVAKLQHELDTTAATDGRGVVQKRPRRAALPKAPVTPARSRSSPARPSRRR
jgi:DNA-binding HxlR family transcriptional regulator